MSILMVICTVQYCIWQCTVYLQMTVLLVRLRDNDCVRYYNIWVMSLILGQAKLIRQVNLHWRIIQRKLVQFGLSSVFRVCHHRINIRECFKCHSSTASS